MIFCTVSGANHLAKAITMAKSLKENMPDSKLILCLLELEMVNEAKNCPLFDEVILPKDLGIPGFFQFIFRHSIYEAACAVKAQLLLYSIEKYKTENKFVYIDSDVKIYSPFVETEELLDNWNIIITPHHLEPLEKLSDIVRIEENQLRVGTYNLGFLAVARSEEAKQFLKWWNGRLYYLCYVEPNRGLFLDQKWMDLAPGLFDVHILKHPGYNVGNWNLPKRNLYLGDGTYRVNSHELRFIHFSGLGTWFDQYLQEFVGDKSNLLYFLTDEYKSEVKKYGDDEFKTCYWSFDYFWSGEPIHDESRIRYRENPHLFGDTIPYELSNSMIASIFKGTGGKRDDFGDHGSL